MFYTSRMIDDYSLYVDTSLMIHCSCYMRPTSRIIHSYLLYVLHFSYDTWLFVICVTIPYDKWLFVICITPLFKQMIIRYLCPIPRMIYDYSLYMSYFLYDIWLFFICFTLILWSMIIRYMCFTSRMTHDYSLHVRQFSCDICLQTFKVYADVKLKPTKTSIWLYLQLWV